MIVNKLGEKKDELITLEPVGSLVFVSQSKQTLVVFLLGGELHQILLTLILGYIGLKLGYSYSVVVFIFFLAALAAVFFFLAALAAVFFFFVLAGIGSSLRTLILGNICL